MVNSGRTGCSYEVGEGGYVEVRCCSSVVKPKRTTPSTDSDWMLPSEPD